MRQDLFREVTRRICGSLNLDEALFDVFLYLKEELPLDSVMLTVYEFEQKRARIIAVAYDEGGLLVDEVFPLSNAAWASIGAWQKESLSLTVPWIRDHTHPINSEIKKVLIKGMTAIATRGRTFGVFSTITCALKLKQQIIGNLTFVAEGEGHYNESHADIISEVNEPFAIALSNALRFMDLELHHKALYQDTREMRGDVMIGADSGLKHVRRLIEDVAPTDSPVLLFGDTGTGKEVAAGEIHKLSLRSPGPMVSLNCGAIPETLIDSELFGHEKGAFTGAIETKPGRFERAHGGTLFLDEVGELPAAAQAKLLRVIQTGEFERVGGSKTLTADVRIIAATHRNLAGMVAQGSFRSDLWYRLNVFPIRIPNLKDRTQDIPAMVEHFIATKCREMNLPTNPELVPEALSRLTAYDWPGNVRELQNIIERALIISKGRPLTFADLGRETPESPFSSTSPSDPFSTLNDAMATHIQHVVDHTRGIISGPKGAAKILGIHPNTLRSRMEKLGIKSQPPAAR